jgi:hypothetical protein
MMMASKDDNKRKYADGAKKEVEEASSKKQKTSVKTTVSSMTVMTLPRQPMTIRES